MARKYDAERLAADIEALLVANLNTKIAALNSEKSDSITLKTIDSSAYFFQELNGKQINYNPFILYGIESSVTRSQRGNSLEEIVMSIIIILEDEGEDIAIAKRMLRYRRCLKEVFEDSFQLVENSSILKVQSLMPVAFESANSEASYRAVGVNVSTAIE